ncbi:MAG: hypothetical protein M1370_12210, partial [Bacteroidetes bacterium]|nr:hypothetical protein [Bacteroidota bacterium]
MERSNTENHAITIAIPRDLIQATYDYLEKHTFAILIVLLSAISVFTYLHFYYNGLGLAYNDARSHLDIGRRVVEGIKPGLAQLGSV